jgi:hypothetical protein
VKKKPMERRKPTGGSYMAAREREGAGYQFGRR